MMTGYDAGTDEFSNGTGEQRERSAGEFKRFNECITQVGVGKEPERAFDEFWRRGELALLFGASGVGKSVLAVQVAEAIARGGEVGNFRIDVAPARVLYVDMGLNDEQFSRRYRGYRFSARLFRGRPKDSSRLILWLEDTVRANGIKYVVLDDLAAFKRTNQGTLETLRLMRELRRLRDDLNISILVLTDAAAPPRRGVVSERDLGPQAALCRVADSVFAIGRHWNDPAWRYLVQTRSRVSEVVWTVQNAVFAYVDDRAGMPELVFENRVDPETLGRIVQVKMMRDQGRSFREIAELTGISKSRAQRLARRWRPGMGGEVTSDEGGVASGAEDDFYVGDVDPCPESESGGEPPFLTATGDRASEELQISMSPESLPPATAGDADSGAGTRRLEACGPRAAPFLYDGSEGAEAWFQHLVRLYPERREDDILRDYHRGEAWCRPPGAIPLYDPEDPFGRMELQSDRFGEPMYIESRLESGEWLVWYQYGSDGRLRRYKKDNYGISGEKANENLFGKFVKKRSLGKGMPPLRGSGVSFN